LRDPGRLSRTGCRIRTTASLSAARPLGHPIGGLSIGESQTRTAPITECLAGYRDGFPARREETPVQPVTLFLLGLEPMASHDCNP
jgi:hypothetical protein